MYFNFQLLYFLIAWALQQEMFHCSVHSAVHHFEPAVMPRVSIRTCSGLLIIALQSFCIDDLLYAYHFLQIKTNSRTKYLKEMENAEVEKQIEARHIHARLIE
jgi:hypothetical protein